MSNFKEKQEKEYNRLVKKHSKYIQEQLTKAKEEGKREGVEGFIQWLMEDKEYTLKMYRDPYETMSICAEEYLKTLEH